MPANRRRTNKGGGGSKKRLQVTCGVCGSKQVYALRNSERALVRCESCGERIMAYYSAPPDEEDDAGTGPEESEDESFIRQIDNYPSESLTEASRAIYDIILRCLRENQYAPTMREIQQEMAYKSVSTVLYYLQQLEEVGLIERDYATARGIRIKRSV